MTKFVNNAGRAYSCRSVSNTDLRRVSGDGRWQPSSFPKSWSRLFARRASNQSRTGRGTKQKNADQPPRPAYPLRHGENSVSEEV